MADDSNNLVLPVPSSARDRVSQLKYQLEGWREVLVPVHSVLTWQRPYYPLVVWAFVSLVFGIFYLLNPSVLTSFALIGIVIMLADYLMPHVQAKLYDPNKWTGAKERKFEDVCYGIACAEESVNSFVASMKEMKRTKPSMYFMTVVVGLLLLAWVGSLIASLWLTYLIVSTLVMIPGLVHRGYLQKFILGPARPLISAVDKKGN